jgi:hypothetical protein
LAAEEELAAEEDAVLAEVDWAADADALAALELVAVFLLQPVKQTASIITARSRQRALLKTFS